MRWLPLLPPRELVFGRLVLIYQMPKIGSQSIEATLRECSFPHPVRRFHYLSPAITKTIRRGVASAKPDPTWKREANQQLNEVREISRVIRLRRLLTTLGFDLPKLEVITGVRELIGLVLSSIFENYLYFAPSLEAMTLERCREAILHPKTFKALRHWFDLELKPFIGVDVFKTTFPHEQGYMTYENQFARVLVYRFDALGNLTPVLRNFLGHDIPALVKANESSAKPYFRQYRFIRENLRLPAKFVRSLYEGNMMRHFYSDEERRRMQSKWDELPPRGCEMRLGKI